MCREDAKYIHKNLQDTYQNLVDIYDPNLSFYMRWIDRGYKSFLYTYMKELINYETPDEYISMESFFKGIHQIIEINLLQIQKNHEKIRLINDRIVLNELQTRGQTNK